MVDPLDQVTPDRVVVRDDDREVCVVCGELPAQVGLRCKRCDRALEEERLDRETYG